MENLYVRVNVSISREQYLNRDSVEMLTCIPSCMLDKISIQSTMDYLWQAAIIDWQKEELIALSQEEEKDELKKTQLPIVDGCSRKPD